MSTEEQQEEFYLELGDIIKINAPTATQRVDVSAIEPGIEP